ncbi:Malic acid transport protein [Colletotrichum orbiculare MAFF 240422]|uniref:Malic acid transport protein n=1 Tax=Colletotrichum orbiculare (strain 104-T / ATCC 96160 / CBS 514.97 / LARS 414 / MAFF 240422) TaxID=1213857 RepID=A0A484FZA6_COLOR|nr:Malic acid transport protein [Colletotrichum orbiculare MAFF 240422]
MTMATGGMANVIHSLPRQAAWLDGIAVAFFLLNLVLFITNCVLAALRFRLRRGSLTHSFADQTESLFINSSVVSFAVICINISMSVLASATIYLILWSTLVFPIHTMTPTWVFPAYPLLLTAPFASQLIQAAAKSNQQQVILNRTAIALCAVATQGAGCLIAFMISAAFIYRLMTQKLPRDFQRPGVFISIGPFAFTVIGIVQLGSQAENILPSGFLGTDLAVPIDLLSQLNVHTTRLSGTLTQLTDDILRSGSRLAYEVELLRGETLGLAETLNETLQEDIKKFIPGGLNEATKVADGEERSEGASKVDGSAIGEDEGEKEAVASASEPPYIKQLRTLTVVRSRLDTVIKTFGDAMEFVFPPSELSVSSSFLSVSAPEPGSDQHSTEDKGQQVLQQLRDEISQLLTKSEDPVQGIEKAAQRIEELKNLNQVWKGTAEEKGRTKFIESLAKMVEDRHRDLMREVEQAGKSQGNGSEGRARKGSVHADVAENKTYLGGYGLMSQLQKLRSGL